jgi:acyl-CoA thioester hydrolase
VPHTHETTLRVRYAETDQMGVVYHANYLAWCEVGRTEYVRGAGMSYREMESAGVGLAVVDASLRFHGAARYDDEVRIETRLTRVGSRLITFEYVIRNAGHRRTARHSCDAPGVHRPCGRGRRPAGEHPDAP